MGCAFIGTPIDHKQRVEICTALGMAFPNLLNLHKTTITNYEDLQLKTDVRILNEHSSC